MGDPFDHVRAQPLALEVLRRAVRESRLPSAYLFESPGGVGKERCALALATAVIGEAAAGHASVRRAGFGRISASSRDAEGPGAPRRPQP